MHDQKMSSKSVQKFLSYLAHGRTQTNQPDRVTYCLGNVKVERAGSPKEHRRGAQSSLVHEPLSPCVCVCATPVYTFPAFASIIVATQEGMARLS